MDPGSAHGSQKQTDLGMALVLQHAVEALGVQVAWMLVCRLAVASWDFREVGQVHLHFPHGLVGLQRGETTTKTLGVIIVAGWLLCRSATSVKAAGFKRSSSHHSNYIMSPNI